ncbi:hypothetical protein GQR58_004261 [Nymphon striatum]|nr:hypothetical protein GQR58_004261 [Nymphon striatum]
MQIPASSRVQSLHKVSQSNIDNKVFATEGVRQFQKTNDGKTLLREMMSGLLPNEIIEAQKQGFSAPDASWFRGQSIDFVRDRIGHSKAAIWDVMDFDALKPLLDRHFGGEENNRLLIWSLLNVDEAINQHRTITFVFKRKLIEVVMKKPTAARNVSSQLKRANWLEEFEIENGRPLRVLHIGNIANNAFINAKIMRKIGIHADVVPQNTCQNALAAQFESPQQYEKIHKKMRLMAHFISFKNSSNWQPYSIRGTIA